jgi:hypothetical protein
MSEYENINILPMLILVIFFKYLLSKTLIIKDDNTF